MTKKLLTSIVFLLFTFQIIAAEPDKSLHEECLYPVVMIQGAGTGSGVIIKSTKNENNKYDNYALTCFHVIQDTVITPVGPMTTVAPEIVVKKANYKDWSTFTGFSSFESGAVYVDVENDLAIVYFESEKSMPVAKLALDEKLYIGTEVLKIGCGAKDIMRLDTGQITSVNYNIEILKVKDLYRMSVPTYKGDSGCPVYYKTKDGYKVVGLTHALLMGMSQGRAAVSHGFMIVDVPVTYHHMGFSIPITRIKNWEKLCQKKIILSMKPKTPKKTKETPSK